MYKTFFDLQRNPFALTPDPSYFVPTDRHNEALAALYYGVRQHKGFIVVTGEVGTGKTLLLRCLLCLLKESKGIAYAYLFNSKLSPTDFLRYIVSDFGLPAGNNKSDLLIELGHFLASRGSRNLTTVLIIDEAHHLSADTLEEVRLLSNLETSDDKLLQIVLVGQPELDNTLDSVRLRQLKQRIALRAQLGPLEAEETKQYIERRLTIAGGSSQGTPVFAAQAIAAIHFHARGIPRLINTICENALITAYARQLSCVTPDIIDDVATDFRLNIVQQSKLNQIDGYNEDDFQQAINTLMNIYASPRNSIETASAPRVRAPFVERQHEPDI